MQRYFITDLDGTVNIKDLRIIITSQIVHHIKDVMRMKEFDEVIIVYQESSYKCKITNILKGEVELKIVSKLNESVELPCEVTIAHAVTRREKMETTIENISQLGASFYIPVILKRCNVKINDDFLKKIDRLNKIATEAAELAHRTKQLKVLNLISFKEFLKFSEDFDLCLVAHVDHDNTLYIKEAIKDEARILVLVGPEGGFDETELNALRDANFKFVSLGKRVLRTELAPSYIMSIIDSIRGENHEI